MQQEQKEIPSTEKKIPRPDNPFFVFKREKKDEMMLKYPGVNSAELSRLMGQEWSLLSKEEKQIYNDKAEQSKKEHMLKYPNYKYWPAGNIIGQRPYNKHFSFMLDCYSSHCDWCRRTNYEITMWSILSK